MIRWAQINWILVAVVLILASLVWPVRAANDPGHSIFDVHLADHIYQPTEGS